MARSEEANKPEGIGGDRRFDRRYQLQLELRWKLIRRRKVQDTGVGFTIDFSSGGVLFDAGRPLPVGLNLELSIAWPVLLHNVAPMQLVVSGRVVRSIGCHVAVSITQHEFRTTGIPADHRQVLATANRTPPTLLNNGFAGFGKMH